jgi:hypothetical protein
MPAIPVHWRREKLHVWQVVYAFSVEQNTIEPL